MTFSHSPICIIFILIFSLIIIIFLKSYFECKSYKINTYNVKNEKNTSSLRLVFLTDLHDKIYKNNNDELINDIIDTNPDYIILGGDFVNYSAFNRLNHRIDYKNAISFFEKLSKKCIRKKADGNYNLKRIFFSLGNHEMRLINNTSDETIKTAYDELISVLKSNNIEILDNNRFKLNDGITIFGLSLYEGYYYNVFKKNKNHEHIEASVLDNYFGKLNDNSYNIIAFHKPDYAEDLIYYGFDLVLSGHNHGGLIRLPFIGSVFSPDFKLFPKHDNGLYDVNGKKLLVSSGMGEHFIRIRFNNKPTMYVINIGNF